MDMERATVQASKEALDNVDIVFCSRHQSDSARRTLNKIFQNFKPAREEAKLVIAELFFKPSSPVNLIKDRQANELTHSIIQKFFRESPHYSDQQILYDKAIEYIEDKVSPRITTLVNYRRYRNPHLDTPLDVTNNVAESLNAKIGRRLDFKPVAVDDLAQIIKEIQEEMFLDLERAIQKKGQYALSSAMAGNMKEDEYPLTPTTWMAKRKLLKIIIALSKIILITYIFPYLFCQCQTNCHIKALLIYICMMVYNYLEHFIFLFI